MRSTGSRKTRTASRSIRLRWMNPMLATLVRQPFSGAEWIFEPKLDGIRCLAYRNGSALDLYSRNRLKLNVTFADLVRPLLQQSAQSFIVDGEVVALSGGVSRFEALQRRRYEPTPLFYYIFDILYLDGRNLTRLPLLERKKILKSCFKWTDPIRFTEHRVGDGEAYFREVCRNGWEGLVAKRAESVYAGERSKDWLKFKCENQQEFVIVGYTDPMGQREGIGALLVAVYQEGRLKYAGKVGTGFDVATLRDLERKLKSIPRADPPVEDDGLPKHGVHWVQPRLVAQIGFTEWTQAGRLRHPRFLGLRMDKKPRDVVRE